MKQWGKTVRFFKRFGFSLFAILVSAVGAHAQDQTGADSSFVRITSDVITAFSNFVFSEVSLFGAQMPWIVVWMGAPMLFLTVYFAFINLRGFRQASKIVRGHYRDDDAPGEVTQFQALSTALSGTVGLGNIAGVAVAISIGGPGATFWMIVIGLCAMSLKFAECTLAVKYRDVRADGTVAGGPMYFLDKGLAARGWKKIGKTLAWTYAILAFPSILQVAQVNQSYEAISFVTGFESESAAWIYGIALAVITAVVIIGGIRSIAGVTAKLVPLMAAVYIIGALVIILGHITEVPAAFATIIEGAFNPQGIAGGIAGVIIIGMKRAVYSTEAGLGSASMAHAAAKTREPVSEGMVALMEPFIDTVLVSTMTALVIVITGNYIVGEEVQGISMTSAAFGSVIGWFPIVLAVAAFLFGFSTIISWGYYSSKVWEFIWGGSNRSMSIFKVTYCVLLIPGAVWSPQVVYDLMDGMFFLMAIPNIIGIYLLAPELKRDLQSYMNRVKSGEIAETR